MSTLELLTLDKSWQLKEVGILTTTRSQGKLPHFTPCNDVLRDFCRTGEFALFLYSLGKRNISIQFATDTIQSPLLPGLSSRTLHPGTVTFCNRVTQELVRKPSDAKKPCWGRVRKQAGGGCLPVYQKCRLCFVMFGHFPWLSSQL
jgi:hypothetical protein